MAVGKLGGVGAVRLEEVLLFSVSLCLNLAANFGPSWTTWDMLAGKTGCADFDSSLAILLLACCGVIVPLFLV